MPPSDFHARTYSDRFVPDTAATLITGYGYPTPTSASISLGPRIDLQNATKWTGGADGLEVVKGDILLGRGLTKRVGALEESNPRQYVDLGRVNARGRWLSPGFVAMSIFPLGHY